MNKLTRISLIRQIGLITGLAATLTLSGLAQQTNSPQPSLLAGPGWEAIQFLGSGSNWMAAPFAIYSPDSKAWGGGVGAFYKVSDFVAAGLRLDYLDREVWMPSGNFQLQLPLRLMGKVNFVPFTFAGLATPISGKGSDNGSPVGIFGAGGAVPLDFLSSAAWAKRIDLAVDYEVWSGAHFNNSRQIRFGFIYKF